MIDFAQCRRNMLDSQLRPNKVTDERVLAAMLAVPREEFVAENLRGVAYVDEDIPLGEGRVLIEPMVLARLLQTAEIGPDDVVLDIGAGTGYTAAVCAKIAATVVSIESNPRLAAESNRILAGLGIDNVVNVEAPLAMGYSEQAPYDVIMFSGGVAKIPDAIIAQLADGGRLCAVVAPPGAVPTAQLVMNCGGTPATRKIFDGSVPYLPGFEPEPSFVF
jgi:protein-L-isoaspartate(D-aspartate) O-methyltransferase